MVKGIICSAVFLIWWVGFVSLDLKMRGTGYETIGITQIPGSTVAPLGEPEPVDLPDFGDDEYSGKRRIYQFKWQSRAGWVQKIFRGFNEESIRLFADDCLLEVLRDGKKIFPAGSEGRPSCQWRSGILLPYRLPNETGKNNVQGSSQNITAPMEGNDPLFQVAAINLGGAYSFHLVSNSMLRRSMIVLAALLATLLVLFLKTSWEHSVNKRPYPNWGKRMAQGKRRFVTVIKSRFCAHAVLFGIHLLIFLYVILLYHPPEAFLFSDMRGYYSEALNWIKNGPSLWSFFQSGTYVYLISKSIEVWGSFTPLVWLTGLLLSGGALFVSLLSEGFLGKRGALFLHVLYTVHVPWYLLGGLVMPDALYTALLLFFSAALLALSSEFGKPQGCGPYKIFGVGLLGGVALVLKLPHLFFALVIPRLFPRVKLGNFFAFGFILPLFLIGLWSKNLTGKAAFTPLSGGLNMVEGKCPEKAQIDSGGGLFLSPLHYQIGETAQKKWPVLFTDAAFFQRAAIQCVMDNPKVLVTSFRYLYYLFAGNFHWPPGSAGQPNASRFFDRVYGWIYTPVIFLAICFSVFRLGQWAFRRKSIKGEQPPEAESWVLTAFLSLIASLFLCVWIAKSELRYRVPFDGVLLWIAVYFLVRITRNPSVSQSFLIVYKKLLEKFSFYRR